MKDIPVYIENTLFPEVFISANKNFSPPSDGAPLDVTVDSRIAIQPVPQSDNQFAVELRVKLDAGMTTHTPYFFNVACLVLLTIDETVPVEQRRAMAMQAGHMIAFPAVREMVASITARQPWGSFSIGLGFLNPEALELPPEEAPKPIRKRRRKTE